MKRMICLVGLLMGTLSSAQEIPLLDATMDNINNIIDDPNTLSTSSTMNTSTMIKLRYRCPVNTTRNLFCTMIYAPTCGWYDPTQVNCYSYPCATDFSSPCMACKDSRIKYITCGKCPRRTSPMNALKYITSKSSQLPTCINSPTPLM